MPQRLPLDATVRSHSEPSGMPRPLAIYIGVVCGAAAIVLGDAVRHATVVDPRALVALLLLSLLASIVKVEIPVAGHASTLTACHVIDLIALVLFGTSTGVIVAAWGAWTQCTFRNRVPNAPYKTAFSIACLALTAWFAGHGLDWMRAAGMGGPGLQWESLAAAATISFVVNSSFVAVALAMATTRRFFNLWFDFFFTTWPSYVIGAVLAGAIVDGVQHQRYWLAPLLATALALIHRNHQSVAERINDSITDPLTGLHNQRFVSAHVERELARARRNRHTVALAVLDVDDFKGINDLQGHAAGDRALKRVAEVLKQVVREYDVCARYGGDEFVIVMGGCGEAEAQRRIDEARRLIAAPGPDAPLHDVPLQISAGVAVFPQDGDRFETLFAAADSRMYECKERQAVGTVRA